MNESRALLLIADIGGYTRYMSVHRVSLAHAQANVARLLKAVIKAAGALELIEIEGDAVFLSRPVDGDPAQTTIDAAHAMHRAFHAEKGRIVRNLCPCEGCNTAGELTLKFVAHVGPVAVQKVNRRKSLVGPDVILVHRLLKNSVPIPEYVLFSADLYSGCNGTPLEQELEGLGPVQTYFVPLEPAPDPAPEEGLLTRLGETFGVLGRGLPYLVGLKKTAPAA
jgi:class 3 adenylate cyclase